MVREGYREIAGKILPADIGYKASEFVLFKKYISVQIVHLRKFMKFLVVATRESVV